MLPPPKIFTIPPEKPCIAALQSAFRVDMRLPKLFKNIRYILITIYKITLFTVLLNLVKNEPPTSPTYFIFSKKI